MTVALFVNRLLNQFFAEYLSVIESLLATRGYHAVPFETLSRADRAEELVGMIDQRLCDAIIALEYTGDPEKSRARPEGFPMVVRTEEFGRRADTIGETGTVYVDYEPATRHLFETLRGVGASRIGLLSDTRHDLNLPADRRSPRAESQLRMLTECGLFRDASQCVSLSQESDLGAWARATEALLTQDPEIDCLLVHNATVTPAVLHQLAAMGRRVGEDIALATYDDPISAKWLGNGLTVVRELIGAVAEQLVQTTLDRIERRQQGEDARLEAELVVRGSSRLSR